MSLCLAVVKVFLGATDVPLALQVLPETTPPNIMYANIAQPLCRKRRFRVIIPDHVSNNPLRIPVIDLEIANVVGFTHPIIIIGTSQGRRGKLEKRGKDRAHASRHS